MRNEHRQIWLKHNLKLACLVLGLTWAFPGMAFVVSGQITDVVGAGIPLIQVEIYDDDVGPDTLLNTTYANATGNYSINLTNIFVENPDVYISVNWFFQMLPAAAFNDHLIKLTNIINTTLIGKTKVTTVTTTYTPKVSAITADHNPANPLPNKNLPMNQAQPGGGGIVGLVNSINIALNYYQNNKGGLTWEVEWDVPVRVRTGDIGSFHSVGAITIAQVDIPPMGTDGFASDIYHEMGHLVHYRIGDDLPVGSCGGPHWDSFESNHSCAIKEGWASYIGELTDSGPGIGDGKYLDARDTMNTHWRGNEASPTGRNIGTYESGDVVEGAYSGTWFAIDQIAGVTKFADNFKVMFDDDPDNMFEFIDGITNDFGANTAASRAVYFNLQTHGIVYSRARFENNPFNESEPPDTAPGSEESYVKEIDGVMFLRGKDVTVELETVPKEDLGVDETLLIDEVRIGYKTATNGTGDAASALTGFTPNVNFAFIDPDLELDTQAIGDGDWDLVVSGKNNDSFEDNLLPSWAGDGNMLVNTDERHLKILGTWYDKDREHRTNTNKEGKVVIDNTAPNVVTTQFQPPR